VKSGRYPKPVKLGPRITAWRVEDTIIDLMRVQAARMEVWNAALSRAGARAAQAEKHEFGGEFDRPGASELRPARDELEREAGICIESLPQLQALERYERRAHSWWKRATAVLGPSGINP
jgi:hypothetical protein